MKACMRMDLLLYGFSALCHSKTIHDGLEILAVRVMSRFNLLSDLVGLPL